MDERHMDKMLDEECKQTLLVLSSCIEESEDAQWELKKLAQLNEMRMAERKAAYDEYCRDRELRLKEAELEDAKRDRVIHTALDIAGILIPTGVSCYWMAKGLKFEETGCFTSRVGQWVSSHLRLFGKK